MQPERGTSPRSAEALLDWIAAPSGHGASPSAWWSPVMFDHAAIAVMLLAPVPMRRRRRRTWVFAGTFAALDVADRIAETHASADLEVEYSAVAMAMRRPNPPARSRSAGRIASPSKPALRLQHPRQGHRCVWHERTCGKCESCCWRIAGGRSSPHCGLALLAAEQWNAAQRCRPSTSLPRPIEQHRVRPAPSSLDARHSSPRLERLAPRMQGCTCSALSTSCTRTAGTRVTTFSRVPPAWAEEAMPPNSPRRATDARPASASRSTDRRLPGPSASPLWLMKDGHAALGTRTAASRRPRAHNGVSAGGHIDTGDRRRSCGRSSQTGSHDPCRERRKISQPRDQSRGLRSTSRDV